MSELHIQSYWLEVIDQEEVGLFYVSVCKSLNSEYIVLKSNLPLQSEH